MQGNTTIPPRKEVDLGDLNKGAELLLRDPKSKEKLQTKKWRQGMEQAIIALSIIGLGLVVGYLVRGYIQDTTIQYSHPEMFDENGNPLPDELLAIRFEGKLNETDDD